ncbi:MAG: aminotransferase class IV, partial [Acidobacteriota bacterium]|nr:aminotransferase class IV [Acidobacteriota bacterium]
RARLLGSARALGFRVPSDLDGAVARELARATTEVRVRLLLSRSGRLEVQVSDPPAPSEAPVRLAIDDEPVSSQWALLYHKSTQRGLYERRRRRHPDADDVVMVNERGECTEVTTATIAIRRASAWLTPPIASGCLPGVERARLLEEGRLVEAVLTPADLRGADEIAVINSLRGWRRAVLT